MLRPCYKIALTFLFGLLLASGCHSSAKDVNAENPANRALNATVSVSFGPDGRLWRLIPTDNAVFVDSSTDNGKTYGNPVKINSNTQKISTWPENPPAITVSASGRIHVLYYADEQQQSTSFFSYSDDNGQTFSKPVLISDHADSAMHYMDQILVDNNNNIYTFWHDARDDRHSHHSATGALSLYYAVTDEPATAEFSNRFISGGVCSCCRTAITFSPGGKPVILVRMVFPDGTRDHALITMTQNGQWSKPQRTTHDDWKIDACPEHGPALSIDTQNRAHLAWFTLGDKRQGIYYAHTDDLGKTLSEPMPLGNAGHLPGHPDVIALGSRVVLAWVEFDGNATDIVIKESTDRGLTWSKDRKILNSSAKSGHPKLVSNGEKIFLSWTSNDAGHHFIEI
ncbi:MAG: glycoside hydrolase [Methylobacter sp.]|uniref:sialidase family protein n=1 Tax=Methylobacter sp. TaxID=2051955 RepID=UPI00258EA897|nr:sialidase family protein [Methylobacter sp.]MCL7422649.1 glycoside hydrolase [Methylobacter sp.]